MTDRAVLQTFELGRQWPTVDPFLFCVHHLDDYPSGDGQLAPSESTAGRPLGEDFGAINGWNMYHGRTIPGFPQHPHRGFETITYVRRGRIDHSDSLGATARFGAGDTQWMTAGAGIVHAEMFPLVETETGNPLELFQIWLNLPAADKMVDPYFTMLWDETTPRVEVLDNGTAVGEVVVVAGSLQGVEPLKPPPNSWASQPEAELALWHIRLDGDATFTLPATTGEDVTRTIYCFHGDSVTLDDDPVKLGTGAIIDSSVERSLTAGPNGIECLILQGRSIGEPVAQYGPFVMNSEAEIRQAFADYQATRFGGWPWPSDDPTHGTKERFAVHADGRVEDR